MADVIATYFEGRYQDRLKELKSFVGKIALETVNEDVFQAALVKAFNNFQTNTKLHMQGFQHSMNKSHMKYTEQVKKEYILAYLKGEK